MQVIEVLLVCSNQSAAGALMTSRIRRRTGRAAFAEALHQRNVFLLVVATTKQR